MNIVAGESRRYEFKTKNDKDNEALPVGQKSAGQTKIGEKT